MSCSQNYGPVLVLVPSERQRQRNAPKRTGTRVATQRALCAACLGLSVAAEAGVLASRFEDLGFMIGRVLALASRAGGKADILRHHRRCYQT